MERVTLFTSCPFCRVPVVHRLPRRFWMRVVPGSHRYYCDNCGWTCWVLLPSLGRMVARVASMLF